MTAAAPALAAAADRPAAPRWLAPALLALLVLPFDPFWIDAEQARRGLLLVLAGAVLVGARALAPVRGERWLLAFVGALVASALIAWTGDVWFRAADAPATFQPWDAAYRVAHWVALVVALRLGAATAGSAAVPFAVLLALTSAFGLVQALGLANVGGYGVEREPASVFGNLNVASEWTAVATMVTGVLALAAPQRTLLTSALALAGAYLIVNGSRSGLVALPLGLVALALLRRRANGWIPLACVAGGALLGLAVLQVAPAPRAPPAGAVPAAAPVGGERGARTIEVRLEIAKGAAKLFASSPVTGLGPGQFALHYPRVRSAREIELSSHGRQFVAEVRTAHDDWLELLVDGGVVALLLFAAAVFALQRAQQDKARLLPLLVLLLLMFARAPLWNAPAAVAALWLCGMTDTRVPVPRRWHRPVAVGLGIALIALGVPVLLGSHFAARYQQQRAAGAQADVAHVHAASWLMPYEPRFLQLLSQERLFARDVAGAVRTAARALQLRPHDPQLYFHLGEALAKAGQYREAHAVARQGLAIDPPNPGLRVLASAVLAQLGDADGAVLQVAVDPHPALRAQLATHFRDLATIVEPRDPRAAARFRVEHHFVAAVDLLGDAGTASLAARNEHIAQMNAAMQQASRDARPLVLGALSFLDQGKEAEATRFAADPKRFPALMPWQRALLGDHLARLQALDAWRPFLGKR